MPTKVLLDTNLLVLFVVGMASPDYITRHKRLTAYSVADYRQLLDLLVDLGGGSLVATPHILAEASNFLNTGDDRAQADGHRQRTRIMQQFKDLISRITEIQVPAARAVQRPEFMRLGLADAALLESECDDTILVTTDGNLCTEAYKIGRQAENFEFHQKRRRQS